MSLDFSGRVAIVTGAGGGLGREHALALAKRGAKVVVNDLGGARDGSGSSASAAQAVVDEIIAAGGEAIANSASVTDFAAVQAMVQTTMDTWGRIDILINNAGILRDKSFGKMELDDFRLVLEVHLMGGVHCCKAVWPIMVAQNQYFKCCWSVRKFWSIQLQCCQTWLSWLNADLIHRRCQTRYSCQCLSADCSDAHDQWSVSRSHAQCDSGQRCRASDVSVGCTRRTEPHDIVCRRWQF